jgi:hypothetical protein
MATAMYAGAFVFVDGRIRAERLPHAAPIIARAIANGAAISRQITPSQASASRNPPRSNVASRATTYDCTRASG